MQEADIEMKCIESPETCFYTQVNSKGKSILCTALQESLFAKQLNLEPLPHTIPQTKFSDPAEEEKQIQENSKYSSNL